jgi:hypothetical protein
VSGLDPEHAPAQRRSELLAWIAGLGAVTAEALAVRSDVTVLVARALLKAAVRDGQLASEKPLATSPALYTVTRAGLRACGEPELAPCEASATSAAHLVACATVAAVLERGGLARLLWGERTLRREERLRGTALASATIGAAGEGERRVHRPDLVLWPSPPNGVELRHADLDLDLDVGVDVAATVGEEESRRPIAVEVELTLKSARRLESICAAWARCELVAGVLYFTAPEVQQPLARAIAAADAAQRIAMLPLSSVELPPREDRSRRLPVVAVVERQDECQGRLLADSQLSPLASDLGM